MHSNIVDAKRLTPLWIGVLPNWIYDYLIRNKTPVDSLMTDAVLSERLSLDDIAVILYLNREFYQSSSVDDEFTQIKLPATLVTYDLRDEIISIKKGQSEERQARVDAAMQWSYSKRVAEDVKARLGGEVPTSDPDKGSGSGDSVVLGEASPTYKLLVTGSKIWLVVKPGFLAMLKNPTLRLDFYRDYLNTVTKASSFSDAAMTAVLPRYVEELIG